MRSDAIVDSRMSINHNLDHTLKVNSFFLINRANLAHLANQLLIYDKIIIPTKDFGIVPILIYWFGLRNFEKILHQNSIFFLHKPSLFGYGGNGLGLSGFVIEPSKEKSFEWWQDALFGDMAKAIELQLTYLCPFVSKKQRAQLTYLIIEHSRPIEYDNDFFMKHIVNETYTDIMRDSDLTAFARKLSGNPQRLDLTRIPGVAANQFRVLDSDVINHPVDLLLFVAEINISLVSGTFFDNADVMVPFGADTLLKNKLVRAKILPSAIENFVSLVDLENLPDPGTVVAAGELSFEKILKIRRTCASKQFRKWLRKADKRDSREIERLYVRSLGNKSFYESFPVRMLRFAITTSADLLLPMSGIALGFADSFFVEKWLQGYSPRMFFDILRKIR